MGRVEKKWRRLKYLMARVRLPKISSNRRIYFVHISPVFFFLYLCIRAVLCVCVCASALHLIWHWQFSLGVSNGIFVFFLNFFVLFFSFFGRVSMWAMFVSRRWRTAKDATARNVTGGRWACACTRCSTERRPSTPNPWWKPTAASWITRSVRFCVCVYVSNVFNAIKWPLTLTAGSNVPYPSSTLTTQFHQWANTNNIAPLSFDLFLLILSALHFLN